MEVPGLVRGDGVEPRLEPAVGIEGIGGQVHLEEGVLEDVFSRGTRAQESMEELDEVVAVALDEGGEGRAIPVRYATRSSSSVFPAWTAAGAASCSRA